MSEHDNHLHTTDGLCLHGYDEVTYDDRPGDQTLDLITAMRRPPSPEPCAHCGQPRRGYGQINDAKVCHTDPPYPDCYRLVTIYGEPLGMRQSR